MLPEEGAAMRVQLDSVLAALNDFSQDATECGDHDVLDLIARLRQARRAAHAIETRLAPQPLAQGRRGVSLVKVR